MHISGALALAQLRARRPLRCDRQWGYGDGVPSLSLTQGGPRPSGTLHSLTHTLSLLRTRRARTAQPCIHDAPAYVKKIASSQKRKKETQRAGARREASAENVHPVCDEHAGTPAHAHAGRGEAEGGDGGMTRGKRGLGAGSERASQRLSKCLLLALPP